MNQILEVKNILRKFAQEGKNQQLIESWIEIWNQGYIEYFPKLCIESLFRELNVYDFAEYILDSNELIEDRYSCYNRLNIHIARSSHTENIEEVLDIQKKLYKKLLVESIDKFGFIDCIEKENADKRLYIFTSLYFPKSLGHSPSIIIDLLHNELKKYFEQIYVIITPPYHFPYPLSPLNERVFNNNYQDIEDNCLYQLDGISFMKFSGYLTESSYLEFIKKYQFTNKDKFLLAGHSNIHFDLIKSNNKINIPLSESLRELNTASFQIWNDNIGNPKNIFNNKFKIILSPDLTKKTDLKYIDKNKKNIDEKINVAIVGNRLDLELDSEFFKSLEKCVKILPNIQFKIIGEQPNINLISEKLLKNIEFTNFINNLEEYFLKNIDFYLNPKRQGGGHSAIIAIKANIPIITLPFGDVYSSIEKKYHINSFNEITDFIKEYSLNEEFKDKIDNININLLKNSQKKFENMIQTIIKI